MSGLVQKAKEVVHDITHKDSKNTTTTGTHDSTNAGPHNSNVMNKADPRIDSDLDGSRNAGMNQTTHHTTGAHTTTTGHTGTTGVAGTTHGSTNAGPHKSNLLNKLDPRVDSDLDGSRNAGMNQTTHPTGHTAATGTHTVGHSTGTTGIGGTTHGSTNAGPHDSNVMNKMDPRVDSDLDGGRHAGLNQTTHTGGHANMTGTHTVGHSTGTTGIGGTTHGSTNAGPHNSNLMNKMDPRVDSDLDGGRHAGLNQTTHTGGHPNMAGTHTAGHTGTAGIGGTTHGSTNAGPHNSNLMNKMDPRVDSDLDGGRHAGLNQTTHTGGYPSTTGTHTAGMSGTTHGSTNAGPHNSNLMNKMDPRVDSDLDGGRHAGMNQTTHTTHGAGYPATTGTHTAGHTTGAAGVGGPVHNSSIMNKLDPRVDSDLDGSRNAGMNQTTRPAY